MSQVADIRIAANVTACVWHEHRPLVPYTVDWHPGSTGDRCMRLAGSAASMTVTEQGLTCQDLDEVAADSSGLCRILESRWSLSYTSSIAHSGSALTRWTAGKSRSDIVLREPAPGTTVCPSRYHCSQTSVEWGSYLAAYLHVSLSSFLSQELEASHFVVLGIYLNFADYIRAG